jgi:hypothetical protein
VHFLFHLLSRLKSLAARGRSPNRSSMYKWMNGWIEKKIFSFLNLKTFIFIAEIISELLLLILAHGRVG